MSNVEFRQHGDESIMCHVPIIEDLKINIWTGIKFMKVVRLCGEAMGVSHIIGGQIMLK